jgi:DNA-3-methyladenine glycosylase II
MNEQTCLHLNPGDRQLQELAGSDPSMGALMNAVGELRIPLRTDYFDALIHAIVGQQISVKAAATVRARLKEAAGALTPAKVLALDPEVLRGAGVSPTKISYMHDLSSRITSGTLDLQRLPRMDNDEVLAALTAVKGIGRWTADMFLIHSLGRMDVLVMGDAGLQRAAWWLHRLPEHGQRKYLEQVGHLWVPYGTAASLYLWEAINLGWVDSGQGPEVWIGKHNI